MVMHIALCITIAQSVARHSKTIYGEFMVNGSLNRAQEYARQGWRVFPIPAGSKQPMVKNWQQLASTDPATLRDWFPDGGRSVGIACGIASDLVVIDFDVKADGMALYDWFCEQYPEVGKTLTVETGGGGLHAYLRQPEGATARGRQGLVIEGKKIGIDVRSEGNLVVAPPSVHSSGNAYEWRPGGKLQQMGPELLELIGTYESAREFVVSAPTSPQALTSYDRAILPFVLGHIVPDNRDDWRDVGFALHDATGGSDEGFELWEAWAKALPEHYKNNGRGHRSQWESFNSNRDKVITLGDMAKRAEERGYQPPQIASINVTSFLQAIQPTTHESGGVEIRIDERAVLINEMIRRALHPPARLELFKPSDLLAKDPLELGGESFWRGGVLFRGCTALVAGQAKLGKSAYFLAMAMHAACGKPFLGSPWVRPLRVLWLQAEIHQAWLRERLQIALQQFTMAERALIDENLAVTPRLEMAIETEADYRVIAGAVLDTQPDIVCLDPIANLTNANENDNTEVRHMLRHARGIAKMREEGSAVVMLHHISKRPLQEIKADPPSAIRGASAFRGSYDTGLIMYLDTSIKKIAGHWETRNAAKQPLELYDFDQDKNIWSAENAPTGTDGNPAAVRFDSSDIESGGTLGPYADACYSALQGAPRNYLPTYKLMQIVDEARAEKGLDKISPSDFVKLLGVLTSKFPVKHAADRLGVEAVA